jgi:hypothetical protein
VKESREMESTNLTSLPEETLDVEDEQQQQENLKNPPVPAFSSVPTRPPTKSVPDSISVIKPCELMLIYPKQSRLSSIN